MMDNKTCRVDILDVSWGEEGYLIIPRQTRELCEPLEKAADAQRKHWMTCRSMWQTRTGSQGCRQS